MSAAMASRNGSGAAALALAVCAAGAPVAAGGDEVDVRLDGGRVTLVADGAPLAAVLAAWSRAGDTRFVGAEPLGGEVLTLRLADVDEADALRLLLGAAAGYVAAERRTPVAGASRYDRVTVLAVAGQAPRPPSEAPPPRPPPFDPARAGPGPGGGLPAADVQRLLAAVAGRQGPGSTPTEEAPAAGTDTPPQTAPFPGMTVEPGPRGR